MVPDDDGSLSGRDERVSQGENSEYEGKTAHEEFLKCVKESRRQLSTEELKRMLRFAFQGGDLRYQGASSGGDRAGGDSGGEGDVQ